MAKYLRASLIVVTLMAIAGCNTTHGVGYLNPEVDSYRLEKTAVYVDNLGEIGDQLEAQIVEELRKRGVQAIGVGIKARFAKDFEDFRAKVLAEDINDALVVVMNDSRGTTVAGYQSFGSATTYGSTTRGSSTTVPMVSIRRAMVTTAALFTRDGTKVWTGSTERRAQGLAFIGDELTISETVKALIEALAKDGLISP